MIFERQDYQQECIENIITVLEHFDFKAHSTQNLKECLQDFYSKTNANALNSVSTLNTNENSTNSASPLNSTNTPPPRKVA